MLYRYVDKCPDCGQGLVLIVKDKLSKQLFLICDDCETVWNSPVLFYKNEGRITGDIVMQLTEEVSKEDIVVVGWDIYVKNMDNPINV